MGESHAPKPVQLAAGISLDPVALASSRALITANSGGGKSFLLRLIVERCAAAMPVIVIDPEGELQTMRSVVGMLLVGGGGEVPCTVASAGKVARALLQHAASAIIDLSDLHKNHHAAYIAGFLEAVMQAPRSLWRPTLFAIDEAHRFCPEGGAGGKAADEVIDLMSRGRKRGYGGLLFTQRLAKLSKNAAAEAANQFIGFTNLDADLKRAADTLGITKAEASVLRTMEPGEWFAYGPALSVKAVQRFKAELPETKPPPRGSKAAAPAKQGTAIIALAEAVAEAAQDTTPVSLEEAQARIAELEREVKAVKRAPAPVPADSRIMKELAEADRAAAREHLQRSVQDAIAKRDEHWRKALGGVQVELARMTEPVRAVVDRIEGATKQLIGVIETAPPLNGLAAAPAGGIPKPAGFIPSSPSSITNRDSALQTRAKCANDYAGRPARTVTAQASAGDSGDLSGPERRVLTALGWWLAIGVDAPSRVQVAIIAGYHENTKSFTSALGSLRSKGLIDGLRLTDAGLPHAAIADPPSLAAYHDLIRGQLDGVPRRVFDTLLGLASPPSRELLAAMLEYHVNTKSFTNALGRLRTFGLVEYRGGAVELTGLVYPSGLA